MPSQMVAKQAGEDAKEEEEKRASEAALLDTVARILREELNQLEQPGPVSKADIERFLQSAKASAILNLCLL